MLWPKGPETVATLNIGGPNPTYVDYISAQVQKYIYLVQMHEKLAFMRDTVGNWYMLSLIGQDHRRLGVRVECQFAK